MTDTPDVLAQGTIDATDEVIYTAPAGGATVKVWGSNTDAATTVTGIIFRLVGTGASAIIAQISTLAPGESYVLGPLALGNGDTIRAETNTGDDLVSYTVEGISYS